MADINLHFTGDMHAIGAAHNLLSVRCSAWLFICEVIFVLESP
eukprot:SAG11_NODE_1238_length_5425_cov_3.387908_3_plen_43_part_00